jgi:predicted nucleic acid-binding protein
MLFVPETATHDELLAYAYSQRTDDALVAALCKRLEVANETLDALGELPETTGETL